jgi:hypothetical protein
MQEVFVVPLAVIIAFGIVFNLFFIDPILSSVLLLLLLAAIWVNRRERGRAKQRHKGAG